MLITRHYIQNMNIKIYIYCFQSREITLAWSFEQWLLHLHHLLRSFKICTKNGLRKKSEKAKEKNKHIP